MTRENAWRNYRWQHHENLLYRETVRSHLIFMPRAISSRFEGKGFDYVDCSSRSGPAVYVHRSCRTHFGSEPGDDLAHADRYFPEHRHPGDRGGLAVHRHEPRGIRRAAHE